MTALLLLDYTKAFDCINHEVLLSILHYIGFETNAVKFIQNYLQHRTQIVKLNNNLSLESSLDRGVPQGSILGPLLFSVYTSQLHRVIKFCEVHCYADDTQLYYSFDSERIDDANNIINNDIDELITASVNHNLCINPSKSKVMLFGRTFQRSRYAEDLNVKVNDISIACVNEAKNLGLTIDSDLRFKEHIKNCIKKAFSNLRNIYASKDLLNRDTLRLLCNSLVLSHFNYCDVVYGPCLDIVTSRRIQRIQNSCARLICNMKRREHISHKIKEINWLNMANRRLLHALVCFQRIVTTKSPPYLYNKIRFRTDIHNLNVRRKSLITPPLHKTVLFERSFSYNICKLYNKIPADIKYITNINKFKYEMRQIILGGQ